METRRPSGDHHHRDVAVFPVPAVHYRAAQHGQGGPGARLHLHLQERPGDPADPRQVLCGEPGPVLPADRRAGDGATGQDRAVPDKMHRSEGGALEVHHQAELQAREGDPLGEGGSHHPVATAPAVGTEPPPPTGLSLSHFLPT